MFGSGRISKDCAGKFSSRNIIAALLELLWVPVRCAHCNPADAGLTANSWLGVVVYLDHIKVRYLAILQDVHFV